MEIRNPGTATEKAERKKINIKSNNSALNFTAVQAIVCALILLLCFFMMKSGGEYYEKFKNEFSYIMSKDITVKEAAQAFNEIRNFVFSPSDYWTAEAERPSEESGMGGEKANPAAKNASLAPFQTTVKAVLPTEGKITSPFGKRAHPISGEADFHTGIDLAALEGAAVCSAFYGRVSEIGFSEDYGNFIKISHSEGLETMYAHCSEIFAEEGAVIRAGEVIAAVGSTGASTGPHLHFEVRMNGTRYNPLCILKDFCNEIQL